MPPKGKQQEKKIKKVVEDKTFGLKNKNKSKKVQQFINQVEATASHLGKSNKQVKQEEAARKAKLEEKKMREEAKKEQAALFKTVIPETKVPVGVDPKSVLCEFFKVGKCQKGDRCRFSHNMQVSLKSAKIDLYSDPRELAKHDTIDSWDTEKLSEVVNKKGAGRMPPTDIVCFPAQQTRVLTDAGFLFLDEIEARLEKRERVLYACYTPSTRAAQAKGEEVMKGGLVYCDGVLFFPDPPKEGIPPRTLIEVSSAQAQSRWVEGSGAYGPGYGLAESEDKQDGDEHVDENDDDGDDSGADDAAKSRRRYSHHVSLLVTPDHDMYAQLGNLDVAGLCFSPRCVRLGQTKKVRPPSLTLAPTKVTAAQLVAVQGERNPERACARMLACASSGHMTSVDSAQAVMAVRAALRLTTDAQFAAFLELFGFWLGDGSMSYTRTGNGGAVVFAQNKDTDVAFLDAILPLAGAADVRRSVFVLKRRDGKKKEVVKWCIYDRSWFDFFDKEFGLKYPGSLYFDRDEAIARMGNARPASASRPSTPTTVTQSLVSSTVTPSRCSRSSVVDDGEEEDVRVADVRADEDDDVWYHRPSATRPQMPVGQAAAVAPSRPQAASSPLGSATPPIKRSARRTSAPDRYGVYASDAEAAKAMQETEWLYGEPDDGVDTVTFHSQSSSPVKMEDDPHMQVEPPTSTSEEPPMKDDPSDPDDEEPPVDCSPPTDDEEPPTDDEEPPEDDPDEPDDPDDPEKPTKSVKWLPQWVVMHLPPQQLQLLLYGLYRAAGSFKRGLNIIWTSGVAFRDQLVQALLHCGYSAWSCVTYTAGTVRAYHWHDTRVDRTVYSIKEYKRLSAREQANYRELRATADNWAVTWSKPVSTGKAACWPLIRRQQDVKEVPWSNVEHGRIWCVTVNHPDHLIIAQRAQRDPVTGIVNKQSRPIIVGQCKFFLDAIENRQYGWLWECENGPSCHYRHALPPGFVLKPKVKPGERQEEDEDERPDIGELIEDERRKLNLAKCTPITLELFTKWKEAKKKQREEQVEKERKEAAKKGGGAGLHALSGRDLFRYDPSLFQDDEEADDERYVIESDGEQDDEDKDEQPLYDRDAQEDDDEEEEGEEEDEEDDEEEEMKEGEERKQKGAADVSSVAAAVDKNLFLDDDVPDDDDDEEEKD